MRLQLPPPVLLSFVAAFLSCATTSAVAQQPAAVPQPVQPQPVQPQHRYWTTQWSFQDVDVSRLFSRLESIGLDIPLEGEGNVSVDFDVSVPLTGLRDGKAYRFRGHLKSKRLRLENLLLEDFDADLNYADGILRLAKVKGRWADATNTQHAGSFDGTASAQLLPRGDIQADIQTQSLPVGPLHDLLVSATEQRNTKPIRGTLSGALHFRAPIDQIKNVTQWTADGDLTIENFRVGDTLPLAMRTGPIRIRGGLIQATQVEVTSPAAPTIGINLATQIELTGQQRFQFHLRGNDIPLDTLAAIVVPDREIVAGKLDIAADGKGELGSETWDVQGRIGSPNLTILGQDFGLIEHDFRFDQLNLELRAIDPNAAANASEMLLKQVTATYKLNAESLEIADITAEVFEGTINGSATLARKPASVHRLNLNWQNLQLAFSLAPLLPARAKLAAVTSGTIDWSVPSGALDSPQAHSGVVQFSLERIAIGRESIGEVQMNLRAGEGAIHLTGQGKLFGGAFQVDTQSEVEADDSWSTLSMRLPTGQAKAEQMKLDLIAKLVNPNSQRRWRGTASALFDLPSNSASTTPWKPTIVLIAKDIALDGRALSRQLNVRLTMRQDAVVIDRIHGSYAGGTLSSRGDWSIGRGRRQLQIRLAGIDASDGLRTISRQAAERVDGIVSGTFTVTGGDGLRFRGAMTARQSSFFSVPTGTISSGITGSISADLRRWKIVLPSIRGEFADGRITGEAKLSSSSLRPSGFDLSSRWDARQINFAELLAAAGSSSSIAQGRLTGSLTVGGRAIRNSSDLTGRFDAKLGMIQAAAIPGLVEADRFLGIISLAGVQFTEGHIDGVIGAGAATIDEFWLRSSRVKVWSTGKVQLANQRMDVDVVISTGNFELENAKLLAFASQLAVQAVVPVTTLVELNRLLSNRTIHLDFYGPLSDPRIRLKPLEIIREEAARFLLRELLVATSASSKSL